MITLFHYSKFSFTNKTSHHKVTKVRVSTENILFLTCDRNDAHRLVLDLFSRHNTFKRFLVQKETSTIKAIKYKSIINYQKCHQNLPVIVITNLDNLHWLSIQHRFIVHVDSDGDNVRELGRNSQLSSLFHGIDENLKHKLCRRTRELWEIILVLTEGSWERYCLQQVEDHDPRLRQLKLKAIVDRRSSSPEAWIMESCTC